MYVHMLYVKNNPYVFLYLVAKVTDKENNKTLLIPAIGGQVNIYNHFL